MPRQKRKRANDYGSYTDGRANPIRLDSDVLKESEQAGMWLGGDDGRGDYAFDS